MAELTNKQKKEWATLLALRENLTQKEIAEKVGLSRQTINALAKAEKWEERRSAMLLTNETQIEALKMQVNEITRNIGNREEGKRYPDSKEADILGKLAAAIKKLEGDVGLADIVGVGQRFINFVREIDFERAKEITLLYDVFIRQNI